MRFIFGSRRQALQSSRHSPIHAVTPASAGSGMCATNPAPSHRNTIKKTAWSRFASRVVPPQRTTARLRAGIPTLKGAANRAAQRLARPYAPSSASASEGFIGLWRPRKCSTTREVINILTAETNANPNAEGSTVNTSRELQENPAKAGSETGKWPTSASRTPNTRATTTARTTPASGAGSRGEMRAASVATAITISPSVTGTHRAAAAWCSTFINWSSVDPEDRVSGEAMPRMISSCEITIMPPIPQEKPETTACGTRAMWRPIRITQNAIITTEAIKQTLAAPPIP